MMIGSVTASAASPKATDLGPLGVADAEPVSVTIALKLADPAGAEAMMQRVSTPGDPSYQKFLTPEQFLAQFGPSEATVTKLIEQLGSRGLTVERATGTTLKVTGTAAVMERLFQTKLHRFQSPATDKAPSYTFRAPTVQPVIPADIAAAVGAVVGLSTRPVFHPNLRQAPANLGGVPVERKALSGAAPGGNPPGL